MASYYVYSGAGGSANGTSWANAYTTLTTAFSGKAAGDVFYVAHDHAESTAGNVTLTLAGTAASPNKIICVNRSGSVPPVSADRLATAAVTTTAGNLSFGAGYAHYDGIIFTTSGSINAPNSFIINYLRLDNCSLRLSGAGSQKINVGTNGGADGAIVELNNTTFSSNTTNHNFVLGGTMRWRNTASALIGGTIPTFLFTLTSGVGADVECIGVDFSAAGSGKTIVGALADAKVGRFQLTDCKLHASVTKSTVPASPASTYVDYIRSGSSGVNYTIHSHRYNGLLTEETTIVRTGGASDGTTPISWKVVTTADCSFSMPFECPPIAVWNDTTGSVVTAAVEGIWGGGAVPTDEDVFLECEYLGSSSTPQGSFVNDGKADLLASAAGQTSSSETWGGSTTKFKLSVSFTPQQKGWVYARVKCAKASSTFYIDPMVTLS